MVGTLEGVGRDNIIQKKGKRGDFWHTGCEQTLEKVVDSCDMMTMEGTKQAVKRWSSTSNMQGDTNLEILQSHRGFS